MGVGVYQSDFGGAGSTFLVSGPLATQEDYDSYCKELGDDAVSYETWAQDEYDDFHADMVAVLAGAGRALGLSVDAKGSSHPAPRARFDDDFVSVADGDIMEIGWRSWEHDFVVGVSATAHWHDWMVNQSLGEVTNETGRPGSKVLDDVATLSDKVAAFVRFHLMEAGYECRYRTSGYTTSIYELDADASTKKAELKAEIEALHRRILTPASEVVAGLSAEDRRAIAKQVFDEEDDVDLVVPFYDAKQDLVLLYDPVREKFGASLTYPEEVAAALKTLEGDEGLAPIPCEGDLETWFKALQADRIGRDAIMLPASDCARDGKFVVELEDETVTFDFEGSPVARP